MFEGPQQDIVLRYVRLYSSVDDESEMLKRRMYIDRCVWSFSTVCCSDMWFIRVSNIGILKSAEDEGIVRKKMEHVVRDYSAIDKCSSVED